MVLTYAFLCQWVQDVASCLLALGPNSGDNVGLLFEHDLETKVSEYAVLRAGMRYIPLDGSLPLKQLIRLCDRYGLRCVITHSPHIDMVEKLSGLVRRTFLVINLDHLHPAIFTEGEHEVALPFETQSMVVISDWRNSRLYGFGQSSLMANVYDFESNYIKADINAALNPGTPLSGSGGHGMESPEPGLPGNGLTEVLTGMNASLIKDEFESASTVRETLAGIWTEVLPEIDNSARSIPVHGEEKREYYPVSPGQRKIYFQHRADGPGAAFTLSCRIKMNTSTGKKLKKRLTIYFNQLIRRHEILRTSFHLVRGELVQKVHDQVDFTIGILDRVDSTWHFDLSRAPLINVSVMPVSRKKSVLVIHLHLMTCDWASRNILLDDLMVLYNGGRLEPLEYQYKDYVLWYKRMESDGGLDSQLKYWNNVFPDADKIPTLILPYNYTHMDGASPGKKFYDFVLQEEEARPFLQLGWYGDDSLQSNLLAVFAVLLAQWSGQSDLVVATNVKGRTQVEPEQVMGPFEDFLPVRIQPESNKSYMEFLTETSVECARAFENQDIRLEGVFPPSLFNVALWVRQNEEIFVPGVFDVSSSDGSLYPAHSLCLQTSRLDILLQAVKVDRAIYFNLEYNAALMNDGAARRFAGELLNIIRRAGDDPENLISTV